MLGKKRVKLIIWLESILSVKNAIAQRRTQNNITILRQKVILQFFVKSQKNPEKPEVRPRVPFPDSRDHFLFKIVSDRHK